MTIANLDGTKKIVSQFNNNNVKSTCLLE